MDGIQRQLDHMQQTLRFIRSPLSFDISRAFKDARSAHFIRCAIGNMQALRVTSEILQEVISRLDRISFDPAPISLTRNKKTLSDYACMACDVMRRAEASQSIMSRYWQRWITTLLVLDSSRLASAIGSSVEEIDIERSSNASKSVLSESESKSMQGMMTTLQVYLDVQDRGFNSLELFFGTHASLLRDDMYAAATASEVSQSRIIWKAALDTVTGAWAQCGDLMYRLLSTDPTLQLEVLLSIPKPVYKSIADSFTVSYLTHRHNAADPQ